MLLALAEDEPVDMAVPDRSPELVITQVMLEYDEGGVIVSTTRVFGVVEPLRLAETSDGMMTDGIEVIVLAVAAVGESVFVASPLSVVDDISIPNIDSTWATATEPARIKRSSREAITAEDSCSLPI